MQEADVFRLINFMNIVKVMKCDMIGIIQNKVFGMDKNKTVFIQLHGVNEEDLPLSRDVVFEYKDVKDTLKALDVEYLGTMNGDIVIKGGEKTSVFSTRFNPWFDAFISAVSFSDASKLNQVLYEDPEFHKNDIYKRYFSLRATDGIIKEEINGLPMIFFGKMLPSNKSDKVSMTVYDNDDNFYSVRYIISKPKNIVLEVWIKYLKI